ncbi:hypothetical protein AAC387_Pa02g2235 [Persea americana]
MRFSPSPSVSLQRLAAAATNATMSSSRFPSRGQNSWRRVLSNRPGSDGGGRGQEAFVSGDLHFRNVRDSNYGFRHGQRGDYRFPGGFQGRPFRPRPPPRPRPDDYRSWESVLSQPPPNCERFVVLSYNILADYLAKDHRPQLYFHIPPYILDWEWRKRSIIFELGLWSPDIMCLQMRTGPPIDGCAIFWRTTRFKLLHEEHIEFDKLGLRNNVAQICVLESTSPSPTESDSTASSTRCCHHHSIKSNQVVVCNIHVLYNPNRGDIKIGQVRVLLDRAHAVSMTWNGAPVIVCGDFNCTPRSPLYNFILEQKLNLSGLAKNQVSGQNCPPNYAPKRNDPNADSGLPRDQSTSYNSVQPSMSVDDKAGAVEQGNCSTEMHTQHMLQNDMGNLSLTENLSLPQRMMGVRVISSKSCIDVSYETDKVTISDDGVNDGRLENTLEGSIGEHESSHCGLNDVLEESLERCNEEVGFLANPPNLHTSNPALAAVKENLVCGELEKERELFSKTLLSFEDESIQEDESSGKELGTTGGSEVMPIQETLNLSSFDINYNNESSNSNVNQPVSLLPLEGHIVGKLVEVNIESPNAIISDDSQLDNLIPDNLDDSSLSIDPKVTEVDKKPYDPYLWTPTEVAAASGNAECTLVEHHLKLKSTYTEVEDYAGTKDLNREPQVTSYHKRFKGTVDYIWCSEGLQTVGVLDTIPKHVLEKTHGFPTRKWGSDHLALACRLAFTKGVQSEGTSNHQ